MQLGVTLWIGPWLQHSIQVHATSASELELGQTLVRYLIAAVDAALIAGPQALVLRRVLPGIELLWLGAAAAAAALSILLSSLLPIFGGGFWTGYASSPGAFQATFLVFPLVSGLRSGLAFGLTQAIVLSRYVRGVAVWVVASMAANMIANLLTSWLGWQIIGAGTRSTTLNDYRLEVVAGTLIGSAIVGFITGFALTRLVTESQKPTLAA